MFTQSVRCDASIQDNQPPPLLHMRHESDIGASLLRIAEVGPRVNGRALLRDT
jgi:hypothetical protein